MLLDYVRAIACIFIVLYHYTQRISELFDVGLEWPFKISWGYMAVSIFFMLSGYFSVRCIKGGGLVSYLKKKAIRLYPAYWVSIIITFIITSLFLPARAVSIWEMLFNFTMLESFVGVGLVDGAYWTLANEIILYAFIALVVVILKKKNKMPLFCSLWLLCLFLFSLINIENLFFSALGKLIAAQYGHMFIVGISLFYLEKNESGELNKYVSGINILFSSIYQFYLYDIGYFWFFIISLIVIGACIMANNHELNITQSVRIILHPLEFIASISYPLYLIHQNVGYAIIDRLIRESFTREIIILVPICLTMVMAYLIHILVETPVANLAAQYEQNKVTEQKLFLN